MIRKLSHNLSNHILQILTLLWAFLWIVPWAIWLESFPWIRVGIGILMFVTPGLTMSLALVGRRLTLRSHFTLGIAVSVALVGSLGLLGRAFHTSIDLIKIVLALIGLLGLLALDRNFRSEHLLYKPQQFSIAALTLLLGMTVFGIVITMQSRFAGDDLSYLAYLTNWQHAQPLNFSEVIFRSGNIDNIRFWLAMFPMNLALLADISNLHGLLLLGYYLEPFLLPIAILAAYNLYEDLLQSEYRTIAALLLQLALLLLLHDSHQPGRIFFYRLSEDKAFAAFILAPSFFLIIHLFLESSTLRTGILVLLSGLGMALTHPIIMAYSVFIAGVLIGITTLIRRDYKRMVVAAVLMVVILLPPSLLRFLEVPFVSRTILGLESTLATPGVFDLESAIDTAGIETRISYIENTPFYGFNPDLLRIQKNNSERGNLWNVFLSWFYFWILGLGTLWSIYNLKKDKAAPFVLAVSILVWVGVIPYTGWLLGKFVTARMLWRIPWLYPVGMVSTILIFESLRYISKRFWHNIQLSIDPLVLGVSIAICSLAFSYFSVVIYKTKWQSLAELNSYRNQLESLSTLGTYLEDSLDQPSVFVASNGLGDYLPGLSSKSKTVFFRNRKLTPDPPDMDKINLIFSQDQSISINQRIHILKRYHVDYLLIKDTHLKDYYAQNNQLFNVQNVGAFWIIELKKASP